jgi:hypothetical protein
MDRRSSVLGSIVVTGAAVLLVLVTSAVAGNKPGNSVNAKMCQKGGWQSLYTRTGEPFASEQACATYGAQGGQLINEDALACLNDGWKTLGPSTGSTQFASEQECVDYAVGEGTPVAFADVRFAVEDTTEARCPAPEPSPLCAAGDVRVYNDGPVAVTVNVSFDDTISGAGSFLFEVNPVYCSAIIDPPNPTFTGSCTDVPIPAGGSTFILFVRTLSDDGGHAGSASITSTSSPDPNTDNNTISWNVTVGP